MITDIVSTSPGFQTSVNIAYDLTNEEKIKRLIPTTAAVNFFEDILLSTDNASTNRARVLIGAYGKGKSHIILSILSFLYRKIEADNESLLGKVKEYNEELYEYSQEYLRSNKRLLPVIINGSNTSLVQSFMGALYSTLKQNNLLDLMPETHFQAAINTIARWKQEYPDTLVNFQRAINMPIDEILDCLTNFDVEAYSAFEKVYPSLTAGSEFNPFAGFDVVELYSKVIDKLPDAGFTGIFVVYDEFSKYLESSISKASISDIKMLQDFAEKCNRSGSKQLHLLLVSHKQIENYIDVLPKQKVDGWKGVSERFTHVNMRSDFSQIYEIISQAILKNNILWPVFYEQYKNSFDDIKRRFSDNQLFADCDQRGLEVAVVGCYPLHPITTFMLPRISEKVAQNERTLFTFISGQEPTTLSGVLKTFTDDFSFVTPDVLYDYFVPQMRKEVYTSEVHRLYRLTSSILVKFTPQSLHAKIVKTIALIYCLGQFERLAPTVDTIINVYANDKVSAEDIGSVIADLVQKQCVVYLKRSNAYLKLKESSGIDIYKSISDVVQKRNNDMTKASLLDSANLEPYAYPVGYNDHREMTRFFRFVFIDSSEILCNNDLDSQVNKYDADGVVFCILPHTDEEIIELGLALTVKTANIDRAVFVVPNQVDDILMHLQDLDAVQILREAAEGDDLLFDEYDVIYQDLYEVVHRYISQYTHPEVHAVKYYYKGEECELYRKAHLSRLLSDICSVVYAKTPIINNEVINKNKLTTVALNSRTKILAGLLANPLLPNLGLTGSGQEVSFMRSTLITTGVLQNKGENVYINLTPNDENLSEVFRIIDDFFTNTRLTGALSFAELYQMLTGAKNGIGMRKGLIPIFLAAVLRKYQNHIIVRDRFNEVAITPSLLNQINDAPDRFTVKLEDWDDSKDVYIASLNKIFEDYIFDVDKAKPGYSYLVVAMGRWYLSLPRYAKEIKQCYNGYFATEKYSEIESEKRKFISLLKQPSIGALDLLFSRIPKCFGVENVTVDLVDKIEKTKLFFDEIIVKLERILIEDVKCILCEKCEHSVTLSSVIMDWCEILSEPVKKRLYPNGAERLISVLDKVTNDEYSLVETLARVITGLRIDDWTDKSITLFCSRLAEYKITLENANSEVQETVSSDDDQSGYSVVFVDENGKATQRCFERVERGKRSDALYNRINNAIREMGHSISAQEKRQVVMEILEKLC